MFICADQVKFGLYKIKYEPNPTTQINLSKIMNLPPQNLYHILSHSCSLSSFPLSLSPFFALSLLSSSFVWIDSCRFDGIVVMGSAIKARCDSGLIIGN